MLKFQCSYWSIVMGSLQSSSLNQSGTFFSALCKIIRPLSKQPLFAYFTWFCAFILGLIIKKNDDFARSRAAVKLLKWVSSSCALFSRDLISRWNWLIFFFLFRVLSYYFTHTDVRARRFSVLYFCVTTAMTVVTESRSNVTERLTMSGFTVQFVQFFLSANNL